MNQTSKVTESNGYVRFIILSAARTGSNVLASYLNSSEQIVCFRELFNWMAKEYIDFNVEGYDRFSAEDRALRDSDYKRFLQERIFCPHPQGVHAVGFKMPYDHFWGYTGLLKWLEQDADLRVLHLKRRNQLRMLVSYKIAQTTGVWLDDKKVSLSTKLRPANAPRAIRRPRRSAARLWRFLRPRNPWQKRREPLTLSEEECRSFFEKIGHDEAVYIERFHGHPQLELYYDELLDRRRKVLDRVQSFLDVEPRRLTVTMRRQNPEPLRELLANYDELYEAFQGTPYAAFFD